MGCPAFWIRQLFLQTLGIHEVEGLDHTAIAVPLARAVRAGIGACEGIEEFRIDFVSPSGRRGAAIHKTLKFGGNICHRRHGIVHGLCRKSAPVRAGKISHISQVAFIREGTCLIRFRQQNGANQVLQIKLMGHEVLGQPIQQFLIGRRIGSPEIIHRVDDSTTKKLTPNSVHRCPGQKRIVWSGHPIGQCFPWIIAFWNHRRGRFRRLRRHHDLCDRVLHSFSRSRVDILRIS